MTLWSKIWKSLIALSVFFGLISPTEFKFDTNLWIISILFVVGFVIYWHLLEWLMDVKYCVKKYFIELGNDVKFIKNQLIKKKGDNSG